MNLRKRLLVSAAIVVVLVAGIVVLIRTRPARHRVFRREAPARVAVKGIPPVEQWTDAFSRLPPADLVSLLDAIEAKHPDLYAKWSLAYLHARALIEDNERAKAAKKLAPFLAAGNPFRDLALYHQSEISDGEAASHTREELIFTYPQSIYRDQAIDDEAEYLKDAKRLADFAARLRPSADTARRRDLDARIAELTHPINGSLAVLRGGITDDASERAARVLDRPEFIRRLNAQQIELLGETMANHRRFDRAIRSEERRVGKGWS